ncbi:hypothetical protein [Gluconobacter sphaericus]|uniref:hypothetical protein n=1 Tax=Gluconobacter sphaericus TaxID=574987 RepID=UPI00312B7D0B
MRSPYVDADRTGFGPFKKLFQSQARDFDNLHDPGGDGGGPDSLWIAGGKENLDRLGVGVHDVWSCAETLRKISVTGTGRSGQGFSAVWAASLAKLMGN